MFKMKEKRIIKINSENIQKECCYYCEQHYFFALFVKNKVYTSHVLKEKQGLL